MKFSLIFWIFVVSAFSRVSASDEFPLPFSGNYQSLASEARELTSQQNNSWVTIPQNVYLTLVPDEEILELQIEIEVLDSTGQKLYPIKNTMWLRHVGSNQLEIYKINKITGAFDKVGNGDCSGSSCSYEYVIMAHNNGNPYQQRYLSTITWTPDQAGSNFFQSGSLSAKVSDVEDGQDPWLVFKTWTNQFEAKLQQKQTQ